MWSLFFYCSGKLKVGKHYENFSFSYLVFCSRSRYTLGRKGAVDYECFKIFCIWSVFNSVTAKKCRKLFNVNQFHIFIINSRINCCICFVTIQCVIKWNCIFKSYIGELNFCTLLAVILRKLCNIIRCHCQTLLCKWNHTEKSILRIFKYGYTQASSEDEN